MTIKTNKEINKRRAITITNTRRSGKHDK